MSETRTGEDPDDPTSGESIREHPQDPAEGPDEEAERDDDVPRVHPDDPAEG